MDLKGLLVQWMSLLLVHVALSESPQFVDILTTFTDPDSSLLSGSRVDVENITGDVFVGGRNVLYHFSADLDVKQRVSTGPIMDNPECLHPDFYCSKQKLLTDNSIGVLKVVYHLEPSPVLLLCGTVYKGLCQIRPIHNLTEYQWIQPYNESVGYGTGQYLTHAFIGPGHEQQLSLFTALSSDPRRTAKPILSSKILEKAKGIYKFRYSFENDTMRSAILFQKDVRKNIMDGGFVHDDFAYFLILHTQNSGEVISKLVRVCTKDGTFQSYSELPVACNFTNGKQLKIAFSAYMDDSAFELNTKAIYLTFTEPSDKDLGSALCIFPMPDVVKAFTTYPRNCLEAVGRVCQQKVVNTITDFCGADASPYQVTQPLVMPYLSFLPNLSFTATTTVTYFDEMVAIVGDKNGYILKLSLRTGQIISNNDMLDSKTTGSFSSPFVFDLERKHIYLVVKSKVIKYPVYTCGTHTTCHKCMTKGKQDPLKCGWCSGRCAHLEECGINSFTFNSCPPSISEVHPMAGPFQGHNLINITGDYFGSYVDDNHNAITVAGIPCNVLEWKNKEVTCTLGAAPNATSGPVELHVVSTTDPFQGYSIVGSAASQKNFSYYVGPRLFGIRPNKGPSAGGTYVTLYGENFDFEKNAAERFINLRGRFCQLIEFQSNKISCQTRNETSANLSDIISIHFRRFVVSNYVEVKYVMEKEPPPDFNLTDVYQSFEYTPNPQIYDIQPGVTTTSGLMNVTVTGQYLDSVNNPQIIVKISTSEISRNVLQPCWCDPESKGTRMTCFTPSLLHLPWIQIPTRTQPLLTHVGFQMNNIEELINLPKHLEILSRLLYYPDPEFNSFESVEKVENGQTKLELKGNYLDLIRSADNFQIKIGDKESCKINRVSTEFLTCDLPPTLVKNSSAIGTNIEIEVFVGFSSHPLGYIEILPGETNLMWVFISVFFCIVVLIAAIFIACKCFRRNKKDARKVNIHLADDYRRVPNRESCTGSVTEDRASSVSAPRYYRQPSVSREQPFQVPLSVAEDIQNLEERGLIISPYDLVAENRIGAGHFGKVFKGILRCPGGNQMEVAIKAIHRQIWSNSESTEEFLKEALIMKDFNHPHVVGLIGVCFDAHNVPSIVLPYMKNGDLCSYIKDETKPLSVLSLLKFAVDIACGMSYLEKENFVHRDLAARNCLLDSNCNAKVADFGMSRDVYEDSYYCSSNKEAKVPIKWMSPEAFEEMKSSTKSDVWSYGVLVWELMTRGSIPYEDIPNDFLMQHLKSGKRLEKPKFCPLSLYSAMLACWNKDNKKRPMFLHLYKYTKDMLEAASYSASPGSTDSTSQVTIPAQNRVYVNLEASYIKMDNCTLKSNFSEESQSEDGESDTSESKLDSTADNFHQPSTD